MAGAGTSAVPGVTEKERFEAELEFVQALANPEYLHHLAQNRYLDDPDFLAFLEYLQYWREPRYCKYLQFPHCLRMLELLDNEAFRTALKRADFKDMVLTQQHGHWKQRAHRRSRRSQRRRRREIVYVPLVHTCLTHCAGCIVRA